MDDMDESVEQFFIEHCKTPGAVIVVFSGGSVEVFSSLETAVGWASESEQPCVFSPHIIDMPDFGRFNVDRLN